MKRLKLPSNLDNLNIFLDFLKDFAGENGINQDDIQDVEFSCEEIIVNIINYAYLNNTGFIELKCGINDKNAIQVEIYDWGTPFDLLEAPDPDINKSLEDRPLGGLGIFLTRQLMDDVMYKRENDMNITTLIKNI